MNGIHLRYKMPVTYANILKGRQPASKTSNNRSKVFVINKTKDIKLMYNEDSKDFLENLVEKTKIKGKVLGINTSLKAALILTFFERSQMLLFKRFSNEKMSSESQGISFLPPSTGFTVK